MDRKWWTLIAVCFGTFMLLLDITVVNVALPDIQAALHTSFADLQWVVDAYALTLAAFLLTAGVLGDMYGRRGMFAIGLVLFSLASLTCGLATTPLMLNLSRAAQGVGGAIMFATSLALIAQAFSGRERGTAIGVYGAVVGGAVAIGPLVGGAITSGIGWRWIFFVNIPIGVVAVVITLSKVDNAKFSTGRRIDWLGFVTFTASLFLLVYALVQGNAKGWGSTAIVSMLVGSGVLMAVFVVGEWRQDDPMLDLGLFRRPAMVGVSLGSFTLSASIFAMFLYLTLYMQTVLGYSPFQAGVRFLPLTMLAFFAAPVAGKLTVKVQSRFMMSLGLVLVALSCELMSHVQATSSWLVLLPGFLVGGIGIGITNPVLASASVSVVPPERSGMSTGTASTFRQVGIATGIAGLGAVFVHQVKPAVVASLQSTPTGQAVLAHGGSQLGSALASGGVRQAAAAIPVESARTALLSAYRSGFVSTFDHLMGIAAVVALVGAVGCLFLVRQRDFVPSLDEGEWGGDAGDVPGAGGGVAGGGDERSTAAHAG
ncbi:MAG TPA: MFS transporter [Acidimicrobiales bacterium]|nr:MFS transporter [Acidimicrobiales bacterium]